MDDGGRRLVQVARRLRVVLVVLVLAWIFSPPDVRGAVPLWLAFLVALALEAHFFASNARNPAPFFRRADRRPGPDDRARYGVGRVQDWAIVEDEEGVSQWVDLAEDEPAHPARRAARRRGARRFLRPALEALAVLAAVAGLLVLLHRGSWDDLSAAQQRAGEARLSVEASRIAGHPARVGCDTSGRIVGAVQHADGVAEVGGSRAFVTPDLCYALYRLAVDGKVDSFDQTARAIAVLAHESWHLRGERDEGRTECFGLQTGVLLGRRLGLDEDEARRMMRSQLVANQSYRDSAPEYVVPTGCVNRGPLDLSPGIDRFP